MVPRSFAIVTFLLALPLGFPGPAARGAEAPALKFPDSQLEPLAYDELDGWADDDHAAAFKTFLASCRPLARGKNTRETKPLVAALRDVCRQAVKAKPADAAAARTFFEENFRPLRIARLGETGGLLTGYFEPIVDGTRTPNPEFHTPIYRRPPDLVAAGFKPGSAAFPNKGKVGRLNDKQELEPYYDRAAIENGALDGRHLEICWIKDPFEAFSIQIQGSARVRLEDGTMLRINYDGHNGFPYSAIGRALIERAAIPREQMSMDRIHQWMRANPDEADKVRQINRSYVFFRITGLDVDDEPVGAEGVPLTPARSIAVDSALHAYGTPFFIQAELPIDSERSTNKFRRLMVAQDTGSAIVGPARADLYWGAGPNAGKVAGRIKEQGRFAMLVPRALDPVESGKSLPLPPPKPPDEAAKKQGGRLADAVKGERRIPLSSRLRGSRR